MGRVLLAWEQGAGTGHCVKLAVLADRLIGCGHEVWISARDVAVANRVFGKLDVVYVQSPFLSSRPANVIRPTLSLAGILHNLGFGDTSSLDALRRAWSTLFSLIKPDVLVCDHAPTALFASRWHTHRRALIGTGFTVPPATSPLPDLRYWLPENASRVERQEIEDAILHRVNSLLNRDGLKSMSCLADLFADADASFLLTFPELDHYPRRGTAEYFGAWSAPGGGAPEWSPGSAPRVFAYLKPPTESWKVGDFLAFVKQSHISCLLYMPDVSDSWRERLQSSQLRFVQQRQDVQQVAQQCDAAVLNGNAGSASAFLRYGVPQLNIPLNLEQSIMARRIADLGAGLIADPGRPEQMSARLIELLQQSRYREAAQAFQRRYAGLNEATMIEAVAARIHDLAIETSTTATL